MSDCSHMPNLSHKAWMSGRHWAVAFRCARCGKVDYALFDGSNGSEGNLQCVSPPCDWYQVQGMMLCPSCHESFVDWMGSSNCTNSKRTNETCHIEEYEESGISICSGCGAVQPDDFTVYYCWCCGRKVVDG